MVAMKPSRQNHVLRSSPTELRFFDTFERALAGIRQQLGLSFQYDTFEQGSKKLGRHIYTETNRQVDLSVIEDLETPVRYLAIESENLHDLERVSACLLDFLPIISLHELQELALSNMIEDPQSLVRMALGVGQTPDPISLEVIQRGLGSENDTVRFRAAAAACLTRWSDFLEQLKAISEQDSSLEVKEMAAVAMEACQSSREHQ
jgi:AcrR family transcriptional regulator